MLWQQNQWSSQRRVVLAINLAAHSRKHNLRFGQSFHAFLSEVIMSLIRFLFGRFFREHQ